MVSMVSGTVSVVFDGRMVGAKNISLKQQWTYFSLFEKFQTWANSPAANEQKMRRTTIVIPSILGPSVMIYLEAVLMIALTSWLIEGLISPDGEVPDTSISPFPVAFLPLVRSSDPKPSCFVIFVHLLHQEVVNLQACDSCKMPILVLAVGLRVLPRLCNS